MTLEVVFAAAGGDVSGGDSNEAIAQAAHAMSAASTGAKITTQKTLVMIDFTVMSCP